MSSWQIWRAMQHGLYHPAVMRILLHHRYKKTPKNKPLLGRVIAVVIGIPLIILFFITDLSWWFVGFVSPILTLMLLSPFYIGTFSGLAASLNIIGVVNQERQAKRYDLIATTPIEQHGFLWILSHIVYNTTRSVEGTRKLFSAIYIFFIAGAFLLINYTSLIGLFNEARLIPSSLSLVIPIIAVISALYLDLIQSTFVGLLVGVITTLVIKDGMNQRIVGGGVFLSIQILTYIVIGLITWTLPDMNYIVLAVPIIFFTVREGLLFVLIWLFTRRLSINRKTFIETIRSYP
ncbi:MAG: hypothetical protein Kow00117_08500 [Phototrophicales bacterium]